MNPDLRYFTGNESALIINDDGPEEDVDTAEERWDVERRESKRWGFQLSFARSRHISWNMDHAWSFCPRKDRTLRGEKAIMVDFNYPSKRLERFSGIWSVI